MSDSPEDQLAAERVTLLVSAHLLERLKGLCPPELTEEDVIRLALDHLPATALQAAYVQWQAYVMNRLREQGRLRATGEMDRASDMGKTHES